MSSMVAFCISLSISNLILSDLLFIIVFIKRSVIPPPLTSDGIGLVSQPKSSRIEKISALNDSLQYSFFFFFLTWRAIPYAIACPCGTTPVPAIDSKA